MRYFICLSILLLASMAIAKETRLLTRQDYAPGRVILKFYEGTSEIRYQQAMTLASPNSVRTISMLDIHVLNVHPNTDIPALCERLQQIPGVEYAAPDHRIYLAWDPNDPIFSQQTALQLIGCPNAWDYARGNSSFIIALLDTGTLLTHEDLQPKLLPGFDFGGNNNGVRDNDPSDVSGHGTQVTGIAGAATNNGLGIAAPCPDSRILPLKVFRDNGQGFETDLVDAINYAVSQGAHVINMSLGSNNPLDATETALNNAWNQGVVVLAAAGNNGNDSPFYPAFAANAIAVAASNLDDTKTSISNFGSWVEVAAPSGSLRVTRITGSYGTNTQGATSFATPLVSSQACLLYPLVADNAADRNVNRAQAVRQLIENTAVPVPGNYVSKGRISVAAAVQQALTVPVSGTLQINGYTGSFTALNLQIQLLERNTNTVVDTQTVTPNSNGTFTATFFNHVGRFDVALKVDGTLRKKSLNARVRYPGTNIGTISLILGDVNGDNKIDDQDLLSLLFAFGSNDPLSDLNGDGTVNDIDLLILLFVFGSEGE
jgi:thermitase